jgi:hypothetical protein
MFLVNPTNEHPPGFIGNASWNLYQRRVGPERLSLLKIETVPSLVLCALGGVKLETHGNRAISIIKV